MSTPVRRAFDPPLLFTWDVLGDHQGAAGVTDDEDQARARLAEALAGAPAGTRGVVRQARLGAFPDGYRYGSPVAAAETTDEGVTWS
ncbi:hypothetical protein DPM19_11715 [Actinomadura craniellae]|uniref:Uncharacterized protein n=1 Tax=Actinomadura craniellae TaxID=2231787 RepID=A0A365H8M0_9ACTN|nr:hypothetical protein [Actinomadura craniellae]RAY15362.1 hypothetical protein DPM19_11715 [Actinomadura craniellae]